MGAGQAVGPEIEETAKKPDSVDVEQQRRQT